MGDRIPACSWALQGSLTQNSCMNFLVDAALQFQIQHLFFFSFVPQPGRQAAERNHYSHFADGGMESLDSD